MTSDEVICVCYYCTGPIYKYEPRIGFGVPSHWSCGEDYELGSSHTVANTDEVRRYRESLVGIKTRTLVAMANTYEDFPEERLPCHDWMMILVQQEIESR